MRTRCGVWSAASSIPTPERGVREAGSTPFQSINVVARKMSDEYPITTLLQQAFRLMENRRLLLPRRLARGHLLYGADETTDDEFTLLVLMSGQVRGVSSFEGREFTLFELCRGEAAELQSGLMIEAMLDSSIVLIGEKALEELVQVDPLIGLRATQAVTHMLRRSQRLVEDLVFHDVRHRLIRVLCEAADRAGGPTGREIRLADGVQTEELAMRVASSRQTVSTILADLVRRGLLRRAGAKTLIVSDIRRLRRENASEEGQGLQGVCDSAAGNILACFDGFPVPGYD